MTGPQGEPEDDDIAFRLFDDNSHAHFFPDRGDIRCSNWYHFDITQPQQRKGAERHVTGDCKPTDYISTSTSPRRIWNLVNRSLHKSDRRVAVIDLRVLSRFGLAYGSCTDDLGFHHYNPMNETGAKFATKHHVLVLGWLPPQCILGFLSIKQLETLLERSQIEKSSSGSATSS
jgi:hypothetical protein